MRVRDTTSSGLGSGCLIIGGVLITLAIAYVIFGRVTLTAAVGEH